MGLGMAWPVASKLQTIAMTKSFRIRTITAGVHLERGGAPGPLEAAVAFLGRARETFEADGYEVQTVRVATQPLAAYLPEWSSAASLKALEALDRLADASGVECSIGPVIIADEHPDGFAAWAAELVRRTKRISFSARVASSGRGVHRQGVLAAGEAIRAIAHATAGGEGNFRFAATAFIPSGTPFFPAGWFADGQTFSIGLETPNLLTDALDGAAGMDAAKLRIAERLDAELGRVTRHGQAIAQRTGWRYLGIDASPAPGLDASIGRTIETLSGTPFGGPSTLAACAALTDVLKALTVETCGYTGLMLPVLEDPVLARRADERRYAVSELLLYSSVCGTGLDVVPLPGDTTDRALAAVVSDMAALAAKYQKPLSARLLPIPGRKAGERVRFDNPHLTETAVMALG